MDVKIIEKPWGYEKWIEVNDNYVVKELFMKQGHSCSLQYHEMKRETFYVLSGKLNFFIGGSKDSLNKFIVEPGWYFTVEPGMIHKMEAILDSLYLESSTNHLNDVIRIEDSYGRI